MSPGETLELLIGGLGGNSNGVSGGAGGLNGGGDGGTGNGCSGNGGAAGGGGATRINRSSTSLVVAGGGSGSSGFQGTHAGQNPNGDGSLGNPEVMPTNNRGGAGGAGEATVGGVGGFAAHMSGGGSGDIGTATKAGNGGNGGVSDCSGSGGGGGYFGGGGGGSSVNGNNGASGGSGSSYWVAGTTDKEIRTATNRQAGWAKITTGSGPGPGPSPAGKTPGKPKSVKVAGKPTASKYKVSWKKSANATSATKYVVRVFKPGSKKSVIIKKSTKKLSSTITRKQLRSAWLRSRGEVGGVVSFRVTVTAQTGKKTSKAAVSRIRAKM